MKGFTFFISLVTTCMYVLVYGTTLLVRKKQGIVTPEVRYILSTCACACACECACVRAYGMCVHRFFSAYLQEARNEVSSIFCPSPMRSHLCVRNDCGASFSASVFWGLHIQVFCQSESVCLWSPYGSVLPGVLPFLQVSFWGLRWKNSASQSADLRLHPLASLICICFHPQIATRGHPLLQASLCGVFCLSILPISKLIRYCIQ